jgi:hypothetical protein
MRSLINKFKSAGRIQKRGIIYISIAIIGLLYEFTFHNPIRTAILFLWFGLIIISIGIIFTIKDENPS